MWYGSDFIDISSFSVTLSKPGEVIFATQRHHWEREVFESFVHWNWEDEPGPWLRQILARTTIGNLGLYVDTWRQLSMGNSWRDFHDMAPMAAVMEPILGGKSWKHERHPKAMCLCAMHASCSNVLMRLLFRWTQDTTILDPLLLGEAARKS